MNERPIIFSGPMVRAILDGRKTQTRRVCKLTDPTGTYAQFDDDGWPTSMDKCGDWSRDDCPYGKPGDRLWVKEAAYWDGDEWQYLADFSEKMDRNFPWYSPRFMSRAVSRITLEVVSVRVERVQAISFADVLAEGIEQAQAVQYGCYQADTIERYRDLWDSIKGKKAPWASNPWVWVVEFKRVQP